MRRVRLETGAGTVGEKTATAFLTTAETDWHRRVDTEPNKNLGADAGCYLVTGADSNKSLGTMACGPVRRLGTAGGRVWDIVKVEPTGGDKPGLVIPEGERWQQSRLRPQESSLWRPDDKAVPDGADTLAVPPPPAATAAYTDVSTGRQTLELKPANGRLVVPDGTLTLKGLATPATIGSGAQLQRPADGEKFVAAVFGTTPTLDQLTGEPAVHGVKKKVPGTKWTVTVGSEQRPVEVLPDDAAKTIATQTIVVSVPVDTPEVLLTASSGSVAQSLSLVTGKRTSTAAAAAYYRTARQATLEKSLTDVAVNQGDDFESQLSLTLHKAELTPWDKERGWAPAGKAWVRVSLESELEYTWILYDKKWAPSFVTATADGAQVPAVEGSPESEVISFLVPETTRTVTIKAAPRLSFASNSYSKPSPLTGTAVYPALDVTAAFQ